MLHFFREMGPNDKVIVFFGRKAMVDYMSAQLALSGVNCQSIHGSRDQCDREQALEDMKTGYAHILLATDVASRGLDIEDITYVVLEISCKEKVYRINNKNVTYLILLN